MSQNRILFKGGDIRINDDESSEKFFLERDKIIISLRLKLMVDKKNF